MSKKIWCCTADNGSNKPKVADAAIRINAGSWEFQAAVLNRKARD